MFKVYQHWDPLKVCVVGRAYSPEFYAFIKNDRARAVMERIARETEEDYQKLIAVLQALGVEVLRPQLTDDYTFYLDADGHTLPPPVAPRDYIVMLGNRFYLKTTNVIEKVAGFWQAIRTDAWPESAPGTMAELLTLPEFIKRDIRTFTKIDVDITGDFDRAQYSDVEAHTWSDVVSYVASGAEVVNRSTWTPGEFGSASTTRVGRDIYLGTEYYHQDMTKIVQGAVADYPEYRWHVIDTGGHADGTYCPVKPGLLLSSQDIATFDQTFPGWEVVRVPGQNWNALRSFMDSKNQTQGKWWVPGEELNDDFTDLMQSTLSHWTGYVEESVFDLNILVVDEQNVICSGYNKTVFDAYQRHDITPHIVDFRHRYFWDGGIHCITADVHREGVMQNYFPERD